MSAEPAWMRHPDLPDSDPIEVTREQVPHLAAGGWFEVDPPPKPAPRKEPAGGDPSAAPAAHQDLAGQDVPTGAPKSKARPHRTPRRREEKSD